MGKISQDLVLLEQALSPQSRWILSGFFAVVGLYYATEFGVRVGKALYFFTH